MQKNYIDYINYNKMLTKYLLRTDILCTGSREFVLYIFFDGEELSLGDS